MVAHGKERLRVSEVERKCFWKPVTELKIKMHEYSLSIKGNGIHSRQKNQHVPKHIMNQCMFWGGTILAGL